MRNPSGQAASFTNSYETAMDAPPTEPSPLAEARAASGIARFALVIDAPAERVFAALTDPATLARWTGAAATCAGRVGGSIALDAAPVTMSGRVIAYDAPRSLVWSVDLDGEVPDAKRPPHVRFALAERADGQTELTLVQDGLPIPADPANTSDRVADQVEALWALRLEALRARCERDVDLYAYTEGERHLLDGHVEEEALVRAAPREVLAALREEAERQGEVVLSSVASDEGGGRLVTLRHLEALMTPTVIGCALAREGALTRVRAVHRGFASMAPWWTTEEQLIRTPALALEAPKEAARLERRLRDMAASLEACASEIERTFEGPLREAWRAWTDLEALVAWLPGRHEVPQAIGERLALRALADEPFASLGAGREAPWPGLDATLIERACSPAHAALGLLVDDGPDRAPYLAHLALSVDQADRTSVARVTLTGFGAGEPAAARREAAAGRWAALLDALGLALAGTVALGIEVAREPAATFHALTDADAVAAWLHPSALPDPAGVLVRAQGAAGPAERVVVASARPPEALDLTWPWGNPPELERPLRARFTLEAAPRAAGIEGGAPDEETARTRVIALVEGIAHDRAGQRLGRVARERAIWRRHLLDLRAHAETGAQIAAAESFRQPLADGQIRVAAYLCATPSAVFDRLCDPARPLVGLPTAEEALGFDGFAGGRWQTTWGEGRVLQVELDRVLACTFPAVDPDEPPGDTVLRYRLEPVGASGLTRLTLEEQGFDWTAPWQLRRLRQLRSHRFALEELRAQVEHGGTLRFPGVREALGEGAARAEHDVPAPAEAVWEALEGLRWLAREARLGAPGEALALEGVEAPFPETVAGLVLARRAPDALEWLMPSADDGATLAVRLLCERRGKESTRIYAVVEGLCLERPAHQATLARLAGPEGLARLLARLAAAVGG